MSNEFKPVAIIQARMSSTRLPGKVLMDLCGRPMIVRMIERVKRSKQIKEIVIATSEDPSDDPLAELCEREGINCFRGDLNNLLERYYLAATKFKADPVIRLTGDCPLIDPEVVDQHIEFYKNANGKYQYVTNVLTPTYPDGLDISVFSYQTLKDAFQEAKLPSELEHVVPWIWKNCDLQGGNRYRAFNIESKEDFHELRWTVDHPEDLEFVRQIFEAMTNKPNFSWTDVILLLKSGKNFSKLNQNFVRDAGYLESLKKDKEKITEKNKNEI